MTNAPATTPASDPDRPAESGPRPVRPAPGASVVALLAVVWLGAMLWSARSEITSARVGAIAITLAANALPVVVSAALVAGAAAGLAAVNLLARRGALRATGRFAASTAAGLIVGLLGALAITLSFPAGSARMILAGTAAAAAVLGGALAGIRVPSAVGAVVCATLAAFVVVLALSRFNDQLLSLFGAGDSGAGSLSAGRWVSRLTSFTAGLAAGLVSFGYLRWAQRRAAASDPARPTLRWPVYLAAGAGPGLVLLVAEVIVRVGGGSLLDLAGGLSEADSVAQQVLSGARMDHGITVLFVGALAALIAFGRTLGPAPGDEDEDEDVDRAGAREEPAADVSGR